MIDALDMRFMPIILAAVTLISTGLGEIAAFRFSDRLHFLLGVSSGAVLAVALFDILVATENAGSGEKSRVLRFAAARISVSILPLPWQVSVDGFSSSEAL
jgi:xanthine/uracil permease